MDSQGQWLSNPYTSQPMLQSIEKQPALPWGQPPPLPSNELVHVPAPASTAASKTPSRTSSQTPSRVRRIATPRQPSTPRRAPSSQASQAPVSPNTRQLTKDDHIHILRLAISHGDAWGHGTNAAFWTKIADLFEKTTGKKHKTLGRAVDQLVKARRKAIEEEDSGENELQCSYTNAVDD